MSAITATPAAPETSQKSGFTVRTYSAVTSENKAFEKALLEQPRRHPLSDDVIEKVEIPLTQQTLWLENSSQPFLLIQIATTDGLPAGQVVAYLYRSKKFPILGHAIVPQLGAGFISHDAEFAAYEALKTHLSKLSYICRIRVQALRLNQRDLMDFENLARRAGYHLVDPLGVTRTLVYDLHGTIDEILGSLDKKTRAKVRHSNREKVEIRAMTQVSDQQALQKALNASFSRTQGTDGFLEFDTFLSIARNHPDRALILGLYLKSRPTELMAYLINIRHDTHVEAVSAGSMGDPELRKLHFNYFLFWDRVLWAKEHSNTFLDLGGVTDGGATDPLAGISAFKRHFTKKELEIGREVLFNLRPWKNLLHQFLKMLVKKA